MNPAIRHAAERLLLWSGATRITRARHRRDTLILAYHNILPEGARSSGDASLHLPVADFAQQLDVLAETHDVVSLESVLSETESERPRAVVTFDDAYHGCLSNGLPELVKRGMPTTVFVAPRLLGGFTWWDRLADPKARAVPASIRDRALAEFAGMGETIVRAFDPSVPTREEPHLRIATESELALAAASSGISVASHTWSHCNLAALEPEAIDRELQISVEWLGARFTNFLPWLSYPYGLFSPVVEQCAARAGFAGALRVDGGWMRRAAPTSRFALPRFNVPAGISIDGFRLRASGLVA